MNLKGDDSIFTQKLHFYHHPRVPSRSFDLFIIFIP